MHLAVRAILASAIVATLAVPPSLSAQSWPDAPTCSQPPNAAAMRVYLPLPVIRHLESTASSQFVQAYLIALLAESDTSRNWLTSCAVQFTHAAPSDIVALRTSYPDAHAILKELRKATEARESLKDVAATLPTLKAIADRVASDTGLLNTDAVLARVRAVRCTAGAAVCQPLEDFVDAFEQLRAARSGLSAHEESARRTDEAQRGIADDARATLARLSSDEAQLQQLQPVGTDASAAIRTLAERIKASRDTYDLLVHRDSVAARAADSARVELQLARRQLDSARSRLAAASAPLESMNTILRGVVPAIQAAQSRQRDAAMLQPRVAAPSAMELAGNPATVPVNMFLGLTDFILARARKEVVNSFVINLHALGEREPLIQQSFPDTWGLMQGLGRWSDGHLNAVDVGRIPLTTWRSTLANDFIVLPATLVERGQVTMCAHPDAGGDSTVKRRVEDEWTACQLRAATLTPLAPVARRLINGDPILDVLRDAADFTPPSGTALPAGWRRVPQGLRMVADLAHTYYVQGHVKGADPQRQPYVLSVRSFADVSQAQRAAFLRVLLVRAIESRADSARGIQEARFASAVAATMRAIEGIASDTVTVQRRGQEAATMVHAGFTALVAATTIGKELAAQDSSRPVLDTIARRWQLVSQAVEPLFAHDFALSLSRTTTLLRDVRGDVPGAVLTFSALASSLSEAKNGYQVQQAFEAAASPVGGWQAKRYGEGGASLSAFPGVAAGVELVRTMPADAAGAGDAATAVGVSLPVGVEWLFGQHLASGREIPDCVARVFCGAGFFIPVVDLGALASYRVSNTDNVASEPNATFKQVFAPGLYLSLPMFRTVPLTMLAGGQLMPSLRTVTTSTGTASRSAWRLGVNLGLDVKLLGF